MKDLWLVWRGNHQRAACNYVDMNGGIVWHCGLGWTQNATSDCQQVTSYTICSLCRLWTLPGGPLRLQWSDNLSLISGFLIVHSYVAFVPPKKKKKQPQIVLTVRSSGEASQVECVWRWEQPVARMLLHTGRVGVREQVGIKAATETE